MQNQLGKDEVQGEGGKNKAAFLCCEVNLRANYLCIGLQKTYYLNTLISAI